MLPPLIVIFEAITLPCGSTLKEGFVAEFIIVAPIIVLPFIAPSTSISPVILTCFVITLKASSVNSMLLDELPLTNHSILFDFWSILLNSFVTVAVSSILATDIVLVYVFLDSTLIDISILPLLDVTLFITIVLLSVDNSAVQFVHLIIVTLYSPVCGVVFTGVNNTLSFNIFTTVLGLVISCAGRLIIILKELLRTLLGVESFVFAIIIKPPNSTYCHSNQLKLSQFLLLYLKRNHLNLL